MARLRQVFPLILISAIVSVPVGLSADDRKPAPSVKVEEDKIASPVTAKQASLEKAFAKQMTNATLVGAFTIDGKGDGKAPRAERYELGLVKKVKDGYWLFTAKIKYGSKDIKIPIPITVQMKWAGDTPVITMTDFKIPAVGTFTARVLFYGDRYVGTWQHGKVGGHMFGKIEPAKTPPAKTKKP